MALNSTILSQGIRFEVNNDPRIIAFRIADSYATYALTAQSCAGTPNPGSIEAAHQVLKTSLLTIFKTFYQSPQDFANALATAFTGFWFAPPIAFLGPSPGIVTLTDPNNLRSSVLSFLDSNTKLAQDGKNRTTQEVSKQWADALDGFTKAVLVVHGPSPSCTATLI